MNTPNDAPAARPPDPDYPKPEIYEKLVRDGIPRIIEEIGIHVPIYEIRPPEEIPTLLLPKLPEEAEEYASAKPEKRVVELSDILEVLREICLRLGYSEEPEGEGGPLAEAARAMADMPNGAHARRLAASLRQEAAAQGIPWDDVEETCARRAEERGPFRNGVYLKRTEWSARSIAEGRDRD